MANFIVNQTTDDGTGLTTGHLSYAILQANQLAGDDTITINNDVRVTGVVQTQINSNITIVGNSHSISGDANNNGINDDGDVRPLFIQSGTVGISDLTITNGRAKGGDGSGGGAGLGGGLFIYDGSVSLTNVAFSNNTAQGGNGGFGAGAGGAGSSGGAGGSSNGSPGGNGGNGDFGGGGGYGDFDGGNGGYGGGGGGANINNGGFGGFGGGRGLAGNGGYTGILGLGGGGAGLGGGIFVRSGSLTLNNTSFTNNTATGGEGYGGDRRGLGGGIFIMQSLTNPNGNNQGMPAVLPTVNSVGNPTFSGNSAADDAGTATNNDDVYGTINVTASNNPPTANNDNASVTEGQSVIISVLANDTDPDTGDILTLNSFTFTNSSKGTVIQNADGTFSYSANLDFFGADSFTYNIKDNSGAISNTATVNLTINPLNLEGGSGNDTLTGTATPNILNGNAGDDYIEGRAENDTINGGLGFNDRIFGGADNDTITDPDGILGAHGGTGNDTITVTFAAAWDNDTNPNNGPRSDGKITGGYGDDIITVTMNKSNFFLNLKGDEPVSNTPQDGNDLVSLFGSYGNAVIDLGGGNDTFNGGAGSDNISGGNGNDLLLGNNGNDQLAGQNGNDTLRGGAGNDQLTGGAGNDVFVLAATEGKDTITDFADTQDFLGLAGGLTFGQLSINASGSNTQIKLTSTNEVLAILTCINPSVINASDFITV